MMKALFATALHALVGVTALAPTTAAQGPGVCLGMCVEVTKVDSDVYNNIQTCAGNVAVQIGVDNDANFCSGNQTNGDGFWF